MRNEVMDIAKRRGFFWQAFDIYGGLGGFYDYGPLGTALKDNIIAAWRKHFVIREGLAEIDSPNLTPREVFEASGHLEEFADYLTRCTRCGAVYRVDELTGRTPGGVDSAWAMLREEGVRCPECGGELTEPVEFNLMFRTHVGAGMEREAYLRPETAQGIFVNFLNYYRYFREKLPFGVAQVGKGFRNEISPRKGLLRQREFNMAEIEVFLDPEDKVWGDFREVENEVLTLITRSGEEHRLAAREALARGVVTAEPLLYFMARTKQFLVDIGIQEDRIRFRQHPEEELAHYSSDCWDCEVHISYGWVEVVGIADRTAFDLSRHMEHSGIDLRAFRRYSKPVRRKVRRIVPSMRALGPMFRDRAGEVAAALERADPSSVDASGRIAVKVGNELIVVPPDGFTVEESEVEVTGEKVVPHVIEPSFGIDRILYALMEHAYYTRPDSGYRVLRFRPKIAPVKVAILPLMAKDGLDAVAMEIHTALKNAGIRCYYDDSGSIGRRYARADEIGVPFAVTVDYRTLEDDTVTVRERDSTEQVRVTRKDLPEVLRGLIEEAIRFEDVKGP